MPDRDIKSWDIQRKMTTACEPGQFAVHVSGAANGGSGAAIGETWGSVKIEPTAISGSKFAGVTEHYHVSLDTTKFDLNELKGEHLIDHVTELMVEGFVVTDQVSGTPATGDIAYVAGYGKVSSTQLAGAPVAGKFESALNENGYAKVRFSTLK